MRLIDADKLSLHLADWAMAEAPDERTPNKAKEYTAKDMQEMIYHTINEAIKAVDRALTIRVKGEKKKKEFPTISPTAIDDAIERIKKESGMPPSIKPGALKGVDIKVVSLEASRVVPVFEFTPIRPRKKIEIPEPMKETIIRFDSMQEAYDKLVAAEPEVVEINEWQMCEAGYRLALQQAREAIEAEIGRMEDPVKSTKTTGLLRARSIIREMEKL